jgi:hypothetical protein
MEARFILPTLRHRRQLIRKQVTGGLVRKGHGDLAETVSIKILVILTSTGRAFEGEHNQAPPLRPLQAVRF